MKQNNKKSLFIVHKLFAELIFDFQALEGMPFTFPEVQTYLQGITVGGHKIADEDKLKQQILGWEKLIELVKMDSFTISKDVAFSIQKVIAKDEVLEIGQFKSGQIGIAGTDYVPPKADELEELFPNVITEILKIEDIREQGYRIHLDFAHNQFFYDGNKRTGLLMANGHLLSNGYAPLSVPAKWLTEYNAGMIKFYETGDHAEMMSFLNKCHETMHGRFS
ncbi:MAG: cell filamentation protein Fic [Desulfovibrio sp. S3730MH75]|nr:MAG: cell filamentation protein Fic [Desulfovibrio sp. S3730MH75]